MKLVFASSNPNKLKEIIAIAPPNIQIVGLKELGFEGELEETQTTIEGNSLQKAEFISSKFNVPCFAEDTGLEIEALNNEPGVYSARYAGKKEGFIDNVAKVLTKMEGIKNRKAQFKTVITYYNQGKYVQFEGITEGEITLERHGEGGFGYDCIFIPLNSGKTYAEMTQNEKNRLSHRKKSFEKFANHLAALSVL